MESEPVTGPAFGSEPAGDRGSVTRALAEPWRFGEGQVVTAEVAVDPPLAAQVVAELGEDAMVGRDEQGGVTVRLEVANTEAFRSWIVGLLDHARVMEPPELRQELTDWLSGVADSAPGAVSAGGLSRTDEQPTTAAQPAKRRSAATSGPDLSEGGPRQRGPLGSAERLRLLLAVLPWLAARGRTPTAELAGRLGLDEPDLVSLLELAACCGLPPYTPDRLMELIVEDGWVSADLGPYLARPRRLSPAEGFALAASARAILAVPGSDPDGALARGLEKLEAALGAEQPVTVELDEPALLATVREATADGQQLEVEYYAASTDERSVRRVDPGEVFTSEGHWYLDAYCHLAQGQRHFRIDRILAARPVGSSQWQASRKGAEGAGRRNAAAGSQGRGPTVGPDRPSDQQPERQAFVPGPETREVVLLVPRTASWVAEALPVQHVVERPDGRLEVTLPVSRRPWLARLLLRLGPEAVVLDPPDLASAGSEAAAQILERYRS
jgi:proteasome accessory factor C